MTLVADGKKRITLPKPVKPGDAFDLVQEGNRFVLVKLEKPAQPKPPKVKVKFREGKHAVASSRTITSSEVRGLMNDIYP